MTSVSPCLAAISSSVGGSKERYTTPVDMAGLAAAVVVAWQPANVSNTGPALLPPLVTFAQKRNPLLLSQSLCALQIFWERVILAGSGFIEMVRGSMFIWRVWFRLRAYWPGRLFLPEAKPKSQHYITLQQDRAFFPSIHHSRLGYPHRLHKRYRVPSIHSQDH